VTDDRPKPRWGEYSDTPPSVDYPPPVVPVTPPQGAEPGPTTPTAPEPRRNTRDIILTTAFLLLGVWDVASRWPDYAALGLSLRAAYETQGMGEFTSIELANSVGQWVNIARAVILVITIVISLFLISRGRRAFWVPLAGGVLTMLVVFVLIGYVAISDPAMMEYIDRTRSSGG